MISQDPKNGNKPKDIHAVTTKTAKKSAQLSKQMEIIYLFGKIDFDPDYDYKAQRNIDGSRSCHSRVGGNPGSIKKVDGIFGKLHKPGRKALSLEAMDEAIKNRRSS